MTKYKEANRKPKKANDRFALSYVRSSLIGIAYFTQSHDETCTPSLTTLDNLLKNG